MAFRTMGNCTECGEKNCEVTVISDDVWACDACLEDFDRCDACGEYYQYIEFIDTADGRHICEYCAEDLQEELNREEG